MSADVGTGPFGGIGNEGGVAPRIEVEVESEGEVGVVGRVGTSMGGCMDERTAKCVEKCMNG